MVSSGRDGEIAILDAILDNSRIANKELSFISGFSNSRITRLIRFFEQNIIRKYTALISYEKVGFFALCTSLIKMNDQDFSSMDGFSSVLQKHDNIVEAHKIFGEYDFMVKIRARSNSHLQEIIENLNDYESVKSIYSLIVSQTVKHETSIPARELIKDRDF